MIDLTTEKLKSLAELTEFWPSRYAGRKTHKITLLRYIQVGCRGVKLEAIRMGGHYVSSLEAVQRFAERLAALDESPGLRGEDAMKMPTPAARRRAAEKAGQELERMGL